MKNLLLNKYLLLLCRLVLGFVFIYAGAEKISDPEGFAQSIINYKLFPLFSVNFIAVVVPWIEVSAGLLLIFGIAVKENSLILSSMLAFFIIIISISLIRGLNIDCGCFGSGAPNIGFQKIIEDALLLIPGILLLFFDSSLFSITNKS